MRRGKGCILVVDDEESIRVLLQQGIAYSPAVVEACLKVFREKGFTFG